MEGKTKSMSLNGTIDIGKLAPEKVIGVLSRASEKRREQGL